MEILLPDILTDNCIVELKKEHDLKNNFMATIHINNEVVQLTNTLFQYFKCMLKTYEELLLFLSCILGRVLVYFYFITLSHINVDILQYCILICCLSLI